MRTLTLPAVLTLTLLGGADHAERPGVTREEVERERRKSRLERKLREQSAAEAGAFRTNCAAGRSAATVTRRSPPPRSGQMWRRGHRSASRRSHLLGQRLRCECSQEGIISTCAANPR
jgi:hypothetical protein